MRKEYNFFVYIMASDSGTLYIGVTNNVIRRVHQHKNNLVDGFTKKYQCHKLVYFEEHKYVLNAIAREKQIKRWRREKKVSLIRLINSSWRDLAVDWYKDRDFSTTVEMTK
jgi:putative endonuclease